MFFAWLIALVIYGLVGEFGDIDLLFWLLLIPFALQDMFDVRKKR